MAGTPADSRGWGCDSVCVFFFFLELLGLCVVVYDAPFPGGPVDHR